MSRLDAYLALLDEWADDALLGLLAAMAAIDGQLADEEMAFLARMLPGRSEEALREWATLRARQPLDVAAIAAELPDPDDRWKVLRFAARMAWKDGRIATAEARLLEALVEGFALPEGAFERVLDEVRARVEAPSPSRLAAALHAFNWSAVSRERAALAGPLAAVVPDAATPIARIRVDGVEQIGLTDLGIAGAFMEGDAFVYWTNIAAFTRVPTLGAAVQLHTEDGHVWTLVDLRLRGLVTLLDHVYGLRPGTAPAPEVRQVAGGGDDGQ